MREASYVQAQYLNGKLTVSTSPAEMDLPPPSKSYGQFRAANSALIFVRFQFSWSLDHQGISTMTLRQLVAFRLTVGIGLHVLLLGRICIGFHVLQYKI
jgi:hypothetical protein